MIRGISTLFAVFVTALSASSEERPQGLLWNRSGLPATLPLLIKTTEDADYFLHLRDVEKDRVVLAAYVRGGEFFQVLVPPGRFELVFASGENWQGEAKLFGVNTHIFTLDQPLKFWATMSQRKGHLIDLTQASGTTISDLAKCQRLALDPDSLRYRKGLFDPLLRDPSGATEAWSEMPSPHYDIRVHVCS
ncbi:hypothetical protein [uncultured Shimia sp.]|uniref:hypothetical protein n=1 Tax=uncultured Shimia sp. TaxID=573152 RepID=UPI002622B4BB|nr:hypothetical protein [uncultured Shimia sp.]